MLGYNIYIYVKPQKKWWFWLFRFTIIFFQWFQSLDTMSVMLVWKALWTFRWNVFVNVMEVVLSRNSSSSVCVDTVSREWFGTLVFRGQPQTSMRNCLRSYTAGTGATVPFRTHFKRRRLRSVPRRSCAVESGIHDNVTPLAGFGIYLWYRC